MSEEKNDGKLRAGRHVAHVESWGVRETKSGGHQVFVKFDLGPMWFGSLNEGRAREITLEALVTMGFRGDDLSSLVKDDACLDKYKTVAIVVSYKTVDGKDEPQLNVDWVNEVDGGSVKGSLDEKSAIVALSGLKVKGDLAHIRKEKGIDANSSVNKGKNDEPPF